MIRNKYNTLLLAFQRASSIEATAELETITISSTDIETE